MEADIFSGKRLNTPTPTSLSVVVTLLSEVLVVEVLVVELLVVELALETLLSDVVTGLPPTDSASASNDALGNKQAAATIKAKSQPERATKVVIFV
jgi:hypothetical protein